MKKYIEERNNKANLDDNNVQDLANLTFDMVVGNT